MEIRFYKAGHTQFLMHGSEDPVFGLAARGDHLFAGTGDGTVKQFNIETLESVREYAGHHEWVFAVDAHPNAHRVAAGAFNGEVRVWNTQTGELVTRFTAAPGYGSPH
jgi:WD40 repeat protein